MGRKSGPRTLGLNEEHERSTWTKNMAGASMSNEPEPYTPPLDRTRGFFAKYPRFFDTSRTDTIGRRMEYRHRALIERNLPSLRDKSLLDLASHDGRFSFAALVAGAANVLGIEARPELVQHAEANMRAYDVEASRYTFLVGDCKTVLRTLPAGTIDTVMCFGFLYHTLDQFEILRELRRIGASTLLIDSRVVPGDAAAIFLAYDDHQLEGAAVATMAGEPVSLVGVPSERALHIMLNHVGYDVETCDWREIIEDNDWTGVSDYEHGRRVSLRATMRTAPLAATATRRANMVRAAYEVTRAPVRADPRLDLSWAIADESMLRYIIESVATTDLRELSLSGSHHVSRDLLEMVVAKLVNLEVLELRECVGLGASELEPLTKMLRLRALKLGSSTGVDDAALDVVSHCAPLEFLELVNCRRISDAGIIALLRGQPAVRALLLGGCTGLTDTTCHALAGLRELEDLRLVRCEALTDEGVAAVGQIVSLEHLNLNDS